MGKKKQEIVPTKLDVFNEWQFDLNTPGFLKEVIESSGQRMYASAWNVFMDLLLAVVTRATELNDPIMNVLMLRLNLYEVPNEERHKIIEQIKKEIEDGSQKSRSWHEIEKKSQNPCGLKNSSYFCSVCMVGLFIKSIDND